MSINLWPSNHPAVRALGKIRAIVKLALNAVAHEPAHAQTVLLRHRVMEDRPSSELHRPAEKQGRSPG